VRKSASCLAARAVAHRPMPCGIIAHNVGDDVFNIALMFQNCNPEPGCTGEIQEHTMNDLDHMKDMLARVKAEMFAPSKVWTQRARIALENIRNSAPNVEISGPAKLALYELNAYDKLESSASLHTRYVKFIKKYNDLQDIIDVQINIRDGILRK